MRDVILEVLENAPNERRGLMLMFERGDHKDMGHLLARLISERLLSPVDDPSLWVDPDE